MTPRLANRFNAIGRASVRDDIDTLAVDIVRRMRAIRHTTVCGTYVYADAQGYVYVVAEICAAADRVMRKHGRFCVGLYAARAPIFPTSDQIKGDLLQHFLNLDYVTERMILDAVVDAEG